MPVTHVAENFVTGLGGYVIPANSAIAYDVDEWQAEKMNVLVESTTSSCLGRRRNATLLDASWTINVPWNSTNTPESVGLFEGNDLALEFRIGGSTLSYKFDGIVEKLRCVSNDKGDIVRLVLSGFAQQGMGNPVAATL